jgi:hypothetical protein
MVMGLNRQQRRERRRKIVSKAASLARELFPEDEGARREWLAGIIAAQLDIPGLGEAAEKRIILALLDLITDLVDGED